MKIVLDGMGGDHAPAEIVKGAVMAAGMIKHDIYIVGKKDAIEAELQKNKFKGKNIKIVDAAEQFLSGYRQKLVVRSAQEELAQKAAQAEGSVK